MSYPLPVALSFCRSDAELAWRNLEWQLELGARWPEIHLTYDTLTGRKSVEEIEKLARRIYDRVERFEYQPPRGNWWPPNQAFQETARYMARQDKSWFWMEADCIPLRADWLAVLSARYHRFGKPFFCPLIPDLGHYNGTGVYPHDTPKQIPHAMVDGACAWDVSAKNEMAHKTADAMATLYHVWTINDGKFHHSNGGTPPYFGNRELLRQIPPSAILFHREKSGSLIKLLQKCKNELQN